MDIRLPNLSNKTNKSQHTRTHFQFIVCKWRMLMGQMQLLYPHNHLSCLTKKKRDRKWKNQQVALELHRRCLFRRNCTRIPHIGQMVEATQHTHIDSVSDSSEYYVMDGTFKESAQKAHANCHLIFIGLKEKLAIFLPQIASELACKRNCISTRCCIIPSCAIKITGNYRVHACHLYRFLYLSSPFTHSVQHSES